MSKEKVISESSFTMYYVLVLHIQFIKKTAPCTNIRVALLRHVQRAVKNEMRFILGYFCTSYSIPEAHTFRKQPTKLVCTRAPDSARGFTAPPTYTRDDESSVNLPAMCEWSLYTSSTTATNCTGGLKAGWLLFRVDVVRFGSVRYAVKLFFVCCRACAGKICARWVCVVCVWVENTKIKSNQSS